MKKFKIVKIALFLSILGLSSCDKMLQVDPKSTVGEEALFSSEEGYQQALVGIYAQFASRELYGDNLTMGFASMIGQNYSATTSPTFKYKNVISLNFKGTDAIPFVNNIWSKGYSVIAASNNLLSKIDVNRNVFTADNYALIKAEALGLRAFMHFDLLRLYGANFETGATIKAIPFRTEMNALVQIPGTVDEVSLAILEDLKIAAELLKGIDPIQNNRNRRFRMNYYAVRALMARVYLFRNDKVNANLAAKEVLNSGIFQLIDPARVALPPGSKDRTFSTEQVFALRVKEIRNWAEGIYFKQLTSSNELLTRTQNDFRDLYEVNLLGSTDIRFANLIELDGLNYFCSKYWQTWTPQMGSVESDRLDQNVSLIRLSEMYYILAETAESSSEAIDLLNKVREKRVIPLLGQNLAEQAIRDEITKEYQKDFYAEGQLFYYYKRKRFARMKFSTKNMTDAAYIIPIPDNEAEFNPNYN